MVCSQVFCIIAWRPHISRCNGCPIQPPRPHIPVALWTKRPDRSFSGLLPTRIALFWDYPLHESGSATKTGLLHLGHTSQSLSTSILTRSSKSWQIMYMERKWNVQFRTGAWLTDIGKAVWLDVTCRFLFWVHLTVLRNYLSVFSY